MEENNKLYVGNLPWGVDNDRLKEMFQPFGEVLEASVIIDKATGRSKGFGFVTMATEEAAQKATEKMNGFEIEGRSLTVNVARPMRSQSER